MSTPRLRESRERGRGRGRADPQKSSSMAHTRDAAQDLHVLVAAVVLLHDSPEESLHNHCREARAKQ
ncbi:unnamed protein product [Sphagnum troendelagicum]